MNRLNNDRGFTLIEAIAVLIIIGILGTVAVSKVISTSSYSVFSEAEILKNHIRFAQIKALGDLAPNTWGMVVGSGSYVLQRNGAPAGINLPGEDSNTHTFASGVSSAGATISWDSWGSPGVTTVAFNLVGGDDTVTVTVTKNTGFIP